MTETKPYERDETTAKSSTNSTRVCPFWLSQARDFSLIDGNLFHNFIIQKNWAILGFIMVNKPFKKYIPILLFIMAFTGFLSTQILWDSFHLNAQQGDQDKQKHSVYETSFQGLKLTTTKSTSIELRNLKEPVVLLNFWASWCVPCLKELPSLVQFQEKFKGQVRVIGINGDEENSLEVVKKTEAKYRLNFESVTDVDSKIANQFLVSTYPVSIIFHKGRVIFVSKKIHNFMDESFLATIESAIKAN